MPSALRQFAVFDPHPSQIGGVAGGPSYHWPTSFPAATLPIRIRAELKGGQLYKESQKATGGDRAGKKSALGGRATRPANNPPKTLKELGISKDQASRWQTMAQNPKAVEKYLRETDDVPTTAGALAAATGKPVIVSTEGSSPVVRWSVARAVVDFKHCAAA